MGKGYLIAAIILMSVGFGNVIYHSIAPPETPAPTHPPSEVTTPPPAPAPTPAPEDTSGHIYTNGAIECGGDGEPIVLVNNPDATNPTYAELVAFIKEDSTDEHRYATSVDVYIGSAEVPYVCSDFAEAVHNNAEAAGIKAAWVGIGLEGEDEGHACNAFETTDRGLVYIDCTGGDLWSRLAHLFTPTSTSWDKVAYVEIGKEYGVIDIDKAKLLSYSFYLEYTQKWQEFETKLEAYNREVERYNQEISGKVYVEGSSELARIEAWEAELDKQKQILDSLEEELGYYWYELPDGTSIVEDIHIHW